MTTKLIVSILVFIGGLLIASSAQAQIAISEEGVTYPDDTEQTSAVPADCPHSESILWDSNAEIWVCESDISPVAYAIGDTGPAGGIVFWTTADGFHGLEAAPYDQAISEWGCSGLFTYVDRQDVFTGDENTTDILLACSQTDIAARQADNFSMNGFDDWYLPTRHELNFLYDHRDVVGGFHDGAYWSSYEGDDITALYRDLGNGYEGYIPKNVPAGVRAIRAF